MKALIWILLMSMTANAQTVVGEISRTGMIQKAVGVPSRTFTESHLESLCRTELRRRPRPNFISLHMYGANGAAPLPQPAHGRTYGYWRSIYDQARRSNEIAEMIAIGDNAVLRMRDANGNVTRRVLAGRDPLQIEVQGVHFEIVYFTFSVPKPYIFQSASIYVRTAAPLERVPSRELLSSLRPVFPDLGVSVHIRNDAWFINEPGYPFFNPFVEEQIPPSPENWKTPTLRCGYWTGSPSCFLE